MASRNEVEPSDWDCFARLPMAAAPLKANRRCFPSFGTATAIKTLRLSPLEPLGFLFDVHLDAGRHVAKHLNGHRIFAERFDRLAQLHLALVDLEAFGGQSVRDICGSH